MQWNFRISKKKLVKVTSGVVFPKKDNLSIKKRHLIDNRLLKINNKCGRKITVSLEFYNLSKLSWQNQDISVLKRPKGFDAHRFPLKRTMKGSISVRTMNPNREMHEAKVQWNSVLKTIINYHDAKILFAFIKLELIF